MPGAFDEVDRLVAAGISRGIYPGAVIVIGRSDTVLYARGYGHLTWQAASAAPDPGTTLWDLASLTKVVATTPSTMRLVEQGRVELDRPLNAYLPRFVGGRKNEVTVRMLLDHTSGLPSYLEFFRLAPTRDSAIALLYGTPLRRPPGQGPEYSDLNFLLLGLLVEQLSHQSLDQFARHEIFTPLAMENTLFLPAKSVADRAAPTGSWRGHPIGGVVNDQNAVRFGGVAGHAGLFSTGLDLARYARFWLRGGRGEAQQVLAPETIQRFLQPQPAAGNRLLGWESPDPPGKEPVAAGALLSSRAYGHTGWTGTEMWLDPERDFFLVFLTNRSYAPRIGRSIRELRAVRAAVADAAVRAAPGACRPEVSPPC
jgi:CubicO group peptidase (beta-lactamase class C family)